MDNSSSPYCVSMYGCYPPQRTYNPNEFIEVKPMGWICPKCGSCINPAHATCPFCHGEIKQDTPPTIANPLPNITEIKWTCCPNKEQPTYDITKGKKK